MWRAKDQDYHSACNGWPSIGVGRYEAISWIDTIHIHTAIRIVRSGDGADVGLWAPKRRRDHVLNCLR